MDSQDEADRLDSLIQSALRLARDAGRSDIAAALEAALNETGCIARTFDLDVLAAEISSSGRPIPLSPGERRFLIALGLQRRTCTRDELVELLYPHLDEGTAAAQVKVYVHRVRRRLGDPAVIECSSVGYCIGKNVRIDLWTVEGDIAAAVRSTGALPVETVNRLSTFRQRLLRRNISKVSDAPWVSNIERRLEAMLLDVTVRLAEAALAERDLDEAARLAAEMNELDPSDERGARIAIRSYLALEDHATALRVYRRYERSLRDEFAALPSAELQNLLSTANRK